MEMKCVHCFVALLRSEKSSWELFILTSLTTCAAQYIYKNSASSDYAVKPGEWKVSTWFKNAGDLDFGSCKRLINDC